VVSSGTFGDALGAPRQQVVDALRSFVATAATRQLEISLSARGPLLERALAATQEFLEGSPPTLAAWRRYQGVVWNYLAPETLTPAQRQHILVPSGLYGLLASDDRIADYRLKMNASIAPLPPLARFWRPHVTEALLGRTRHATILNLLPQEHAASVDMALLASHRNVIDVHFTSADESRAVGHDAKAVKGDLARAVLVDGLAALSVPMRLGWRVERRDNVVTVIAPSTRTPISAP
jgi:uncharacterized protein